MAYLKAEIAENQKTGNPPRIPTEKLPSAGPKFPYLSENDHPLKEGKALMQKSIDNEALGSRLMGTNNLRWHLTHRNYNAFFGIRLLPHIQKS